MRVETRREALTSVLIAARAAGNRVGPLAPDALTEETVWSAMKSVAQSEYWFFLQQSEGLIPSSVQVESVRRALHRAGVSSWWDSALDRDDQSLAWHPEGMPPLWTHSTSEGLASWAKRAATRAAGSGDWWSQPLSRTVFVTTRSLPFAPALGLVTNEDDIGTSTAMVASAVEIPDAAAVLEITSDTDWIDLVESFPLDATESRRTVWGKGERGTRWVLPDWREVARKYDGVHLTVNSYLDFARVPLGTQYGTTMLAGWGPDETVWLNQPSTNWREPYAVRRVSGLRWVVA